MQWSLIKSSTIFSLSRKAFVKRFAPEIKSNRITLAKLAFSAFLSYFLKLATAFATRPKPVKEANTTGVQSNAPSNCGSYDGFACNNVAKQIFSLKAVVQLLIAIVFAVVVGTEIFQHSNRSF